MSRHTDIQWCDSSVNPVPGCHGCELWSPKPGGRRTCYAGLMTGRFGRAHKGHPDRFEEPVEFPGRMAAAARWKPATDGERMRRGKPWLASVAVEGGLAPVRLPRLIFVNDMGDLWGDWVSAGFIRRELFQVAESEAGRRHVWIPLTKRPSRMVAIDAAMRWDGLAWPSNVWAVTSVTSARTQRRADDLRSVGLQRSGGGRDGGGVVRGISFEPLLVEHGEPDWERCLAPDVRTGARIHWAIFGGESGAAGRVSATELGWIRRGVEACRRHGVAVFVKQLGAAPVSEGVALTVDGAAPGEAADPIEVRRGHNGDWTRWPEQLRVREFPVEAWAAVSGGRGAA